MTMVLSQLRTFTAVSDTSVTMPLAMVEGTTIQSPTCNMSFWESCSPATSPRILSLNTSISTAAKAPSPVSSATGDLLTRMATHTITVITHSIPIIVSRIPLSGRFRVLRFSSRRAHVNEETEHIAMHTTIEVYMSSPRIIIVLIMECPVNAKGSSPSMTRGGMMRQQWTITCFCTSSCASSGRRTFTHLRTTILTRFPIAQPMKRAAITMMAVYRNSSVTRSFSRPNQLRNRWM